MNELLPKEPSLTPADVTSMVDADVPASFIEASQKAGLTTASLQAQARQARNEAKSRMDAVLENEAEAIKTNGITAANPKIDANVLQQIYGPEQTAIILERRNAYARFHAATGAWNENTSAEDFQRGIAEADPIHAPMTSPAFKTYVEMYDLAKKRAEEIQKRAEAYSKRRGEQFMVDASQRLLPDGVRPQGVKPLDVSSILEHKDDLSYQQIKTLTDAVLSPAEHTDPIVFAQLVLQKGTVPPAVYQRQLLDALAYKQIKSSEFATLWGEASKAKDYVESYIETNLDPGIVKGAAQAVFKQAQANAIFEYHLWKNSPEGMEADETARAAKGLDIIRRHETVAYREIPNAIGISRFIGVSDRTKIGWDMVKPGGTAQQRLLRAVEAGQLSPAEIVSETENLRNWQTILDPENAREKARAELEKKSKPLGQGQPKSRFNSGQQ